MPISTRFVINSTIALLALGAVALIGIVGMTVWLAERANVAGEQALLIRSVRTAAVELRSAVQAAESSQRGFLVGGNEIYLAPYGSAKSNAQSQLERLRAGWATTDQPETVIGRISSTLLEKIDEMDRSIALKRELRDAEALALFGSNRGKALMDEINLFLSSTIRATDNRLVTSIAEQRRNAIWLRWVTVLGGLIIIGVISGATFTVYRYAREVMQTRDTLKLLNASLENRVEVRTAELVQARDKAEVLLAEVNHRVANSLSLVASLVHMQAHALGDTVAKEALQETEARILAIASVHQRLYSSGDSRFVDLEEYLSSLLSNVETAMRNEGHGASVRYDLEPVRLKTDTSVNLGVIVTEWVTNAFKYAYPQQPGEVRVRLKRLPDGRAELTVEDDGIGRNTDAPAKGTGLGTRIVNAMARTIGAEVEYYSRHPGAGARLSFPSPAEAV
jgi:two-component sensor histidine kinase